MVYSRSQAQSWAQMTYQEFIAFAEKLVQFFGLVGLIIAASAAIAYVLFRRYGEKWIESKFEAELASSKHEHQKELERLRFQINALLDRTIKLHQHEFEVLPEAWAKLTDAYWAAAAFLSPIQQYPDLTRMPLPLFNEFVDQCQLEPSAKEELKAKTLHDRNDFYIQQIYWVRLREVTKQCQEASTFILKNGIFLPIEIKNKFTALSDLIWYAVHENKVNKQMNLKPENREKQQALHDTGATLLKDLEADVSGRLSKTLELPTRTEAES